MAIFVMAEILDEMLDEEINLRRTHELLLTRRNLRDASNPFELPNFTFLKLFRLSKECVTDLIHSVELFMPEPQRSTGIPKHIKILTALHFFGHGSYQLDVGHGFTFALSQPSVSRCISEISDAITEHLLNVWVKYPVSVERKNVIKEKFYEFYEFPNILGCIDCTHIKIIAPPGDHPVYPAAVYYCRKMYYSINTQIICDAERQILNINARFPGSVHDSAIWMSSNVKTHLQESYINGDDQSYLLGDNGYPLEPWLLVPIEDAQDNTPEARYNIALSSVRACVEHTNGLLKSRFRCTFGHRALHYNPIRAAKIIYSCAVLHNMALFYRVDMPNDEAEVEVHNNNRHEHANNNNQLVIDYDWFQHGTNRRRNVIVELFT